MRKHLQYTLLILLLFVCGCTNNNRVEKEIRDLYGKEIVFPEEYTFMGSNNMSNADIIFEKDVKIVTYIEDFQCTSCMYKMVVEWSEQIRSIFKDDVYYVVVMSSEDKEQLEELFRNHPIGASIFLYENSIFGVKNDFANFCLYAVIHSSLVFLKGIINSGLSFSIILSSIIACDPQ